MSQFLNDAFTEASNTALTSHTSDSGHTWSAQASTMTVLGGTGYVSGDSGITAAFQISSVTPPAAEYDVTIVCQHSANAGNEGVLARRTGSTTYYTAYCASGTMQLDKVVSGTTTNLGSWAGALANSVDYTSKLEIRDAAKKVFIDGTERISSADNAITAAGAVGIRGRSSGFINSISGDTAGGGGVSVTPADAAAATSKGDPTVVLGSVSAAPAAIFAATSKVDPVVVLGSLTLAPAPAAAATAAVDPTVMLGSLTLPPDPASAATATVDPAVVLGALSVAPAPSDARTDKADPSVLGSGVTLDAGIAAATPLAVGPTVILSSIVVTPVPAAARTDGLVGNVVGGAAPVLTTGFPGFLADVGKLMRL